MNDVLYSTVRKIKTVLRRMLVGEFKGTVCLSLVNVTSGSYWLSSFTLLYHSLFLVLSSRKSRVYWPSHHSFEVISVEYIKLIYCKDFVRKRAI